ncbi:MAG: hypothetical protein JRN12_07425 [Nitrososphaerota archaeon]|nr:hypothetical protein [Nitrososphaerota archaeon]
MSQKQRATKRDRILELSRLGLKPAEILATMARENMPTTIGYIDRVRSIARSRGEVFPDADENAARTEAVVTGRAGPRKGKGSRSPRRLYEREVAEIAKRQGDIEYRAARNPKMVADYVLETFPRLEAHRVLWGKFERMALATGSSRVAIDEAVALMPPFMDEVATSLANKKPPPKIQDYAACALGRWVEKFVSERRGASLPHGRARTTCGTCGGTVDVYWDETNNMFFCWCAKCSEERTWSCRLCGFEMKVETVGERGYGPVCTGCGRTLVFDEPAPVHVPGSPEGWRLWELLLRSTGTSRLARAWRLVELAESNPDVFDSPDALHGHISFLFPREGGADRVVSNFFLIDYVSAEELARRRRELRQREEAKMWEREEAKMLERWERIMLIKILESL